MGKGQKNAPSGASGASKPEAKDENPSAEGGVAETAALAGDAVDDSPAASGAKISSSSSSASASSAVSAGEDSACAGAPGKPESPSDSSAGGEPPERKGSVSADSAAAVSVPESAAPDAAPAAPSAAASADPPDAGTPTPGAGTPGGSGPAPGSSPPPPPVPSLASSPAALSAPEDAAGEQPPLALEASAAAKAAPSPPLETRGSLPARFDSDDDSAAAAALQTRFASMAPRLATFSLQRTYSGATELFPALSTPLASPYFRGNDGDTFASASPSAAPPPARPELPPLPAGGLERDAAALFEGVDEEADVKALKNRLYDAEFWFKKLRGDLALWVEKAIDLQARLAEAGRLQASQAFELQMLSREKHLVEKQLAKEKEDMKREREDFIQQQAALKQQVNQLKSQAAGADAAVRAAAQVAAGGTDGEKRKAGGDGPAGEFAAQARAAEAAAVVSLTASVAELKTERDGLVGELYYERRKQQELSEALQKAKDVCEAEHLPSLEKLRQALDRSEAERHEIQAQLIQYKIKYAESAFEELGARQQAMHQGMQRMQTVQQMKSLQLEVDRLTSPRGDGRMSPRGPLSRSNSSCRGGEQAPSLLSRVCAALSPRNHRDRGDSLSPRTPHPDGESSRPASPSPRYSSMADASYAIDHPGVRDFTAVGLQSPRFEGQFALSPRADELGASSLSVQGPRFSGCVLRSPRGGASRGVPGAVGGGGSLAGAFAAVGEMASPRPSVDEDLAPPLSPRSAAAAAPGVVQNAALAGEVAPLTSRMSSAPKVPPLRLGDFQNRLRETAEPGGAGGEGGQAGARWSTAQADGSDDWVREPGGGDSAAGSGRQEPQRTTWLAADAEKSKHHSHGWREAVTGTTRRWFGKLNRLTSRKPGGEEEKGAGEKRKKKDDAKLAPGAVESGRGSSRGEDAGAPPPAAEGPQASETSGLTSEKAAGQAEGARRDQSRRSFYSSSSGSSLSSSFSSQDSRDFSPYRPERHSASARADATAHGARPVEEVAPDRGESGDAGDAEAEGDAAACARGMSLKDLTKRWGSAGVESFAAFVGSTAARLKGEEACGGAEPAGEGVAAGQGEETRPKGDAEAHSEGTSGNSANPHSSLESVHLNDKDAQSQCKKKKEKDGGTNDPIEWLAD
ncbi:hypothetical protein BESB_078130 [Besnoitia besnoiti]|uniref:Uncharacterized protein n=1 Tax=Besnoitia besnoiti TaxID=94643 RepID=A0A2A9MDA9_BESBE|nr:hypothetical protein BESB_078130 [Besnoitia besnoiti]PFH33597.1 hypothetical protein BESB_078130 [Besnoitia besnoiti]